MRASLMMMVLVAALGGVARAQQPPASPAGENDGVDDLLDEAYEDGRADALLDVADALLVEGRAAADWKAQGDAAARRGRHAAATAWYLIAARVDPRDDLAAFRLAASLAASDQEPELVMRWLRRAVEAGFWGAPELEDEPAFEPYRDAPGFADLAAKVRARHADAARAHVAPVVSVTPTVQAGGSSPVLVLLHGHGDTPGAWRREAEEVAKLGWLALALPGTVVRAADSHAWDEARVEPTHRAVQAALTAQERAGRRIDRRRVVAFGFGQGAVHAARLVAEHPADYAGAIAISPAGKPGATSPLEPMRRRPVFAVVGRADDEAAQATAAALRDAWSTARLPWREHAHDGGRELPADWDEVRPKALAWVMAPTR